MKTININLIGDLGRTSKINVKKAAKKSSLDAKNQIFAYILLISILVVFAGSLGGWLLIRKMTHHLDRNLIKLSENINTLKEQETRLSNFREDLNKEKQATEFKIVIQKQFNSSFFPWSNVLREIAAKIPKDIIVTKIEKNQEENGLQLKISGMTSPNQKIYPLTAVSLFIFNLNNNQKALLSNAKISKLEFNDKTKAYEFEIDTLVQQDKKL